MKKSCWNSRKRNPLFLPDQTYRGRFAPSPTGPLHFGSLVAALGSYLDAKHHNGIWLVRMEDLDTPRCTPEAADEILRTLEAFGLYWDESILYQSQRNEAYENALQQLKKSGIAYPCCCSRKEIADSALHGIEGPVYPGTCWSGLPQGKEARAWRVRTNNKPVSFNDQLQGLQSQHLESEIGDFVVKRADRLFAYQLAVVVDDASQHITHVVRGADLLASTPRQIYLQRLLELHTPAYMHLPVAINAQGEKLSKQTLAEPVDAGNPVSPLVSALKFLRQETPEDMSSGNVEEILKWAAARWNKNRLQGITQQPVA